MKKKKALIPHINLMLLSQKIKKNFFNRNYFRWRVEWILALFKFTHLTAGLGSRKRDCRSDISPPSLL